MISMCKKGMLCLGAFPFHKASVQRHTGRILLTGLLILFPFFFTGCKEEKNLLDPRNPVTVTLWSHGGEQIQVIMNELLAEFNDTVGREKGVRVQGVYYSVPAMLTQDVYESATGATGSRHMPDLFCAYPNNAFRINKIRPLVDLSTRFPEDERRGFSSEFVQYGTVAGKWLLMPVGKSTEALYLNKEEWETFAAATGHTLDELKSWEGISRVAAAYYQWTDARTPESGDGQGFMSVDYLYHVIFMAGEQLGEPLFRQENGRTVFHLNQDLSRRLWDNYYIPYLKGHFRNDYKYTVYNIKQGTTIGGVTTTAFGSMQFPLQVHRAGMAPKVVESLVLPYPVFEGGKPCAPLRGGQDLCLVQSTPEREEASLLFLRWFSEVERNVRFTVPVGYLPVKTVALTPENLKDMAQYMKTPTAVKSYQAVWDMFKSYRLYKNEPFDGDIELEEFLKDVLPSRLEKDMRILNQRVTAGESREAVIADLISEVRFAQWHSAMLHEAERLLAARQQLQ